MTNGYEIRKHLALREYNTAITREDFEALFTKTKEKVTFTFNGWDGKSYDGESRRAGVYRTTIEGYGHVRLVKVGNHLCYIDEDSAVVEKATGESHAVDTKNANAWCKGEDNIPVNIKTSVGKKSTLDALIKYYKDW